MIELDGSNGEGGGQVLRTALTLSMITGQPFRMTNIRAKRPKPGLMRQHLVAVQASAAISDAQVINGEIGARELTFIPQRVKGGDYNFAIGTAGSCTLVLQTLVPALLYADARATVRITGGTHNPMAPPAEFLQRAYQRVLEGMGAQVEFVLDRCGFYPAGGGVVVASVAPCTRLAPLHLIERGERVAGYAESLIAGVAASVATRELDCIGEGMGWGEDQLVTRTLPSNQGPGNALLVTLAYEHVTEVFAAFGEKSLRADAVAKGVLQEARRYVASGAAVGEHLADQLLIPMALAGGGSFTTARVSSHARTNAETIARFLPVDIAFERGDTRATCTVTTRPDVAGVE